MSDTSGQSADQGQQQTSQQGEPNGDTAQQTGQQQPAQQAQQSTQQGGNDQNTGGKPDTGNSDGDDWKGHARTWETRAKANKKSADDALAARDKLSTVLEGMRKLLDPDGAGKDEDPATVAEKAAAERDAARNEAKLARVELAAERAARKAGADVDALLDSRSFLDRLGKLDPSEESFRDDVAEAVKAALKDNPRLKAAPPAPPSSPTGPMNGDRDSGGPMSIDDRRAERRKRRGVA